MRLVTSGLPVHHSVLYHVGVSFCIGGRESCLFRLLSTKASPRDKQKPTHVPLKNKARNLQLKTFPKYWNAEHRFDQHQTLKLSFFAQLQHNTQHVLVGTINHSVDPGSSLCTHRPRTSPHPTHTPKKNTPFPKQNHAVRFAAA